MVPRVVWSDAGEPTLVDQRRDAPLYIADELGAEVDGHTGIEYLCVSTTPDASARLQNNRPGALSLQEVCCRKASKSAADHDYIETASRFRDGTPHESPDTACRHHGSGSQSAQHLPTGHLGNWHRLLVDL